MEEDKITLAIDLWKLAENFNRKEYSNEATELKLIYMSFTKSFSDKELKEVEDYIISIGG